jgi:two-component system, cell cycle response regulator
LRPFESEELAFLRTQLSLHERARSLFAQPELEWVQERALVELLAASDARSGALWMLASPGALQLKTWRGLADRPPAPDVLRPETEARLRAGVAWEANAPEGPVLYVPLSVPGEVLGLCLLSDPLSGAFSNEARGAAELIGGTASLALQNARRFLALQRLGLRDPETSAYNLAYFTDHASKEMDKARRYGRGFSLLLFSLDNLGSLKSRQGPEEARAATRAVLRVLSTVLRDSDVLARVSDQEFFLLLPETDAFGATVFTRRALQAVREAPEVQAIEARLPLSLMAGASTFPEDGEDFDDLVQRCRRRMDERRASLHRRLMLEGLDFWETVELLLGSAQSPRLPADGEAEPSRRGKVSDGLFEALQAEVARELQRDPGTRGLVYVCAAEVRSDLAIARGLERAPPGLSARVYLLGRRGGFQAHPGLTPVFVAGDERLGRHEFLLWLGEASAYALLQRRGKGATWGFHTSDVAVVDGLVAKLQSTYELQPY